MVMRPVGSKKMTLRAGHKVYGVNITEELLADIRRMIYEGFPAVKVAMEVRKATPQELEAVKDIKGNTMCIYGTGWASKY